MELLTKSILYFDIDVERMVNCIFLGKFFYVLEEDANPGMENIGDVKNSISPAPPPKHTSLIPDKC